MQPNYYYSTKSLRKLELHVLVGKNKNTKQCTELYGHTLCISGHYGPNEHKCAANGTRCGPRSSILFQRLTKLPFPVFYAPTHNQKQSPHISPCSSATQMQGMSATNVESLKRSLNWHPYGGNFKRTVAGQLYSKQG